MNLATWCHFAMSEQENCPEDSWLAVQSWNELSSDGMWTWDQNNNIWPFFFYLLYFILHSLASDLIKWSPYHCTAMIFECAHWKLVSCMVRDMNGPLSTISLHQKMHFDPPMDTPRLWPEECSVISPWWWIWLQKCSSIWSSSWCGGIWMALNPFWRERQVTKSLLSQLASCMMVVWT